MKRLSIVAALLAFLSMVVMAGVFDWERAVSLYKQGQFRESIAEFKRVLSEYPDHSDSWKFIGLAYYQLQEYQPAIEPLEKAIALKRKEGRSDPDLYRAVGQAHLSLKSYEKALPWFEMLSRTQMNVAANFYMLGVTYSNLNRAEEAAEAFQKAVKLDPKDGDSWYFLGAQNFRNGKMTEAIAALRSGLAAEPKNVEMLGLLTESLLRQGAAETDERKAAALFDEAVRLSTTLRGMKEDAGALELQGRALLAVRKFMAAETALTKAYEATKQPSAALCFNLGFALAQTKAWTRSSEMLAAADKLNPGDVNTLYYLGFVYENMRRYAPALDAYTRAYEASGRSNDDLKASIERVTPQVRQPE
ncbi:MAG: tetratricopeptide repeat protein [Blastocatellia bacterium]|nr:tetratricopeptide repeat protein [Blastocatellia bacterium]